MMLLKMATLVALTAVPPAYRPFVGGWTCTEPTMGHGWLATLRVMPTASGALRFTMTRDTPYGPPNGQMFVRYHPAQHDWTLWSPTYPFVLRGKMRNGTIHFADPYPRKERFNLSVSHDARTIAMLRYLKNTQVLNLANYVVSCTRGNRPAS